ncbi:MAG: hypothetical protein A3J62_03260 [Candidatus Buchananbacteria bacterium RIFCSPHIGHO2_02_FULL_38_8]|uniref:Translation elongation factor EFTu-like domain-containing protein n=2 Tax=Candidatus Buchananiibacteriota TaxID=1817903 RepID=A0A1G1XV69_9BACT|nr:MAG: hypothetical protein A2731_02465 [Candidatus Buchananbacteria bacterium RIFCSPHIGHO2_01_FULL_39_8]OGY47166.1 MAG: hypothetical protein A3J62_03260 [Candidatus Buchananbacteria bacterium RIFCSPHIGHO2_02_FULL_38_8]
MIDTQFKLEDVFSIEGRGIVLAGTVLGNQISIGDELIFDNEKYRISGIEAKNQMKQIATTGENVGILVAGAELKYNFFKQRKGQILTFKANN